MSTFRALATSITAARGLPSGRGPPPATPGTKGDPVNQPMAPHLQRLLQQRDTIAAKAAEAAAHDLPAAADLLARQADLEEQLEVQLPVRMWRRHFMGWVTQDVLR